MEMNRFSALLLGLAFVCGAAYFAKQTLTLKRDGGYATGTVVADRTKRELTVSSTSVRYSVTHSPIVEYTPEGGSLVQFKSKLWSSGSDRVGDEVPVLYDREDPTDARIDGFFENWFVTIALGILGVCSLLYALGFTKEGLQVERTWGFRNID
jgi:hypothetical protein